MDSVQIGEMLELQEKNHDKLGDILILKVVESDTGTPFSIVGIDFDDGGIAHLTEVGIRLTKETARKLALELLKLAEEGDSQ